ncbi:hypothetical protein DPMN_080626 [Dreissena polymorpha]|uniref:Uncharacterized protein n=1 Tax=Dreissena polymorpha TaxID=45954 RepID=A0A9D3YVI0_DREPO|nr:hypothetical protein DPMN_080626 [Dreissena polymorpha]
MKIWKKIVFETVTCCHYIHIKKTAPLPGGHVFSLITTIFKLVRDIHITNAKHVTSRVKKTPPPVFLPIKTIIELICPIQVWKNAPPLSSPCNEDRKINVASRSYDEKCPATWRPCFLPTDIIVEVVQDIIGMNLLTKFYEDRTINVASRVKNTPPLGSHVFQANVTIFEHIQDIIETNLLTKFHEDWK